MKRQIIFLIPMVITLLFVQIEPCPTVSAETAEKKITKEIPSEGQKRPLEKIMLKPNFTAEEARQHPSLGLVYICPKCKVGHALVHISATTGTVKCNLCGKIYEKP